MSCVCSGHGALTRPLAARARRVFAYEIDRDLAAELRANASSNVTVIEGDFLEVFSNPGSRPSSPVRVAGNLPYNVASPILFKLTDLYAGGVGLSDATLMLQREVADRLVAEPGSRDYGVLTVLIRQRALVQRLLILPPGAFRPAPKVESALVRLQFHPPDPASRDAALFAELVKAAFTRRRKTLRNALSAFRGSDRIRSAEALARAGLVATRRPETLTIAEWVRLAEVYALA